MSISAQTHHDILQDSDFNSDLIVFSGVTPEEKKPKSNGFSYCTKKEEKQLLTEKCDIFLQL
jgi:hypothetical protein